MRIKAGLALAKSSFLEASAFRAYFVFTILSNMIYMIVMYFLWKAIYAGAGTDIINGMSFKQTFVYLALAGAMSGIITTYMEWFMSSSMKSGDIAIYFTRPISYQFLMYSKIIGDISTNFAIMFIPSFIVVCIFAHGSIHFGLNLLLFVIAFIMAALINMTFDFLIGLISFYTESVWGISIMKESIVYLFSGAMIPIAFFPETLRHVAEFLPFQAIFNLPLQILLNKDYTLADYRKVLLLQLFWVVVLLLLSRICYKQASKAIVINGG